MRGRLLSSNGKIALILYNEKDIKAIIIIAQA
jgi:hypothetical protein